MNIFSPKKAVLSLTALALSAGFALTALPATAAVPSVDSVAISSVELQGIGGMSANEITLLQRVLNSKGYSLVEDGLWGPNTARALQSYLNRYGYGLAEDGDFGYNSTTALQRYLNSRGRSIGVDGDFGPETRQALVLTMALRQF